jgi:hypothetical protein
MVIITFSALTVDCSMSARLDDGFDRMSYSGNAFCSVITARCQVAGGGFVASLFAPPGIAAFLIFCVDTNKLAWVFSAKEVQCRTASSTNLACHGRIRCALTTTEKLALWLEY